MQGEEKRYTVENKLLKEILFFKSGGKIKFTKDQYGNVCFNKHRAACRTQLETFLRNDVLNYVTTKDRRFNGRVEGVGSCFAGISVGSNESDLLFIIDIDGYLEEDMEKPGFANYRLGGKSLEQWEDCTTDDGLLMSRKLATLFYHYVEEALKTCLQDKFKSQSAYEHPNLSLTGLGTIATTLKADYGNSLVIDIDLVVAIGCKSLPTLATADWLQGKSEWPNADSAAKIRASGCQLVAKAPYPLSENERTTLWRISFSLAETTLLRELDSKIDAHNICTKECFILMKFYCMCYLMSHEKNVTNVMKSYYLKVILLYECQRFPDISYWTHDKLAERFLSMYGQLYKMIERNKLPDFFMPSVNIMTTNLGGIKRSLNSLLKTPEKALQKWTNDHLKFYFLMDL